jgi:hypothetical protein
MTNDSNLSRSPPGLPMPNSAKVVQHLLAHARLCREIAACSWDKTSAQRLEELAAACVRAAGIPDEPAPKGQLH